MVRGRARPAVHGHRESRQARALRPAGRLLGPAPGMALQVHHSRGLVRLWWTQGRGADGWPVGHVANPAAVVGLRGFEITGQFEAKPRESTVAGPDARRGDAR